MGSSGVLHVQGPVSIVGDGDDDLGTIDSDGTLLFDAGGSIDPPVVSNGMIQLNNGVVNARDVQSNGMLSFSGGGIAMNGGNPLEVNSGEVVGVGTVDGDFVNHEAMITHGEEAGTLLDISGNFKNEDGDLFVTIDDMENPGEGFTRLNIGGFADLGGRIHICLGPELRGEGRVDLMTWNGFIGDFSEVIFECTPNHRSARKYAERRQRRGVESSQSQLACEPTTSSGNRGFAVLFDSCGGGGGLDSIEPPYYVIVPVGVGTIVLVVVVFGGVMWWSERKRKMRLEKRIKKKRKKMIANDTASVNDSLVSSSDSSTTG